MDLKSAQKVFFTMILLSSVALTGCSQPSNNTSTSTNTVLSPITPLGVLQGVLIDAVTQQPIVGAVIDIGLSSATTNQDGQFVLQNIPATQIGTGAAAGTTLTGNYEVSINLKGVTSPVKMSDATIKNRYPDFSFKQAKVEYTSDVSHPLTGVAKGYQFTVGKLAASIAGIATDVNGTPVAAGLDVTLYSNLNAQNSTTGSNTGPNSVSGVVATTTLGGTVAANTATGTPVTGNIIGTAKTVAGGTFAFNNIEAGVSVTIAVQDTAGTLFGQRTITTPTENATRTLSFEAGDAVFVKSTDTTAPKVVSVTPENNSDITPGATSVVFTFSEPIKQTSVVADVSPSNPNGLYSLVDVNFTGPKPLASNLTHSLAWSTDRKTLTVTLPAVGASSKYTVDISRAQPQLKDDADNLVAVVAAKYTEKLAVDFTTNGGATAAAPVIAVTNSASINATTTAAAPVAATLNWLPTSGARGYNVYRTMNEVLGATTIARQTVKVNTTALFVSNYTDAFTDATFAPPNLDYVEYGNVKLTYDYAVKAVNSDGSESAASNTVTAVDVVAPSLAAVANGALATTAVVCGAAATCDATTGKITAITIPFNEQMDQASATTATNYTSAQLGTFSSAVYTPATITAGPPLSIAAANAAKVRLTLTTPAAPLPVNAVPFGFITTGANGVNNTAIAAGDTTVIALNAGTPNQPCVTAATVGTNPAAAPTAANPLVAFTATTKGYLSTGANGVCLVTAVGTDVQTLAVNTSSPGSIAAYPGATGIFNTLVVANSDCVRAAAVGATALTEAPVGDDRFVIGTATTFSVINSGADGICQTTATGSDVQALTVGRGRVGASDDELAPATTVVTVTGVTDVAGNAIAGKTKYNADGTVN